VELVYRRVAKDLWTLVVEDARLVDHLGFLRDFYFLGRGEFFSFFLQSGKRLFSAPPARSLGQAQQAIRSGPWHDACVQCGFDDDAVAPSSSSSVSMSDVAAAWTADVGEEVVQGEGQSSLGSGPSPSLAAVADASLPITAAQFERLSVRLSRPKFSFLHGFNVEPHSGAGSGGGGRARGTTNPFAPRTYGQA
jgi:hypothetical protein